MRFTLVIHKDEHSDYGVTVVDLPGCFSAGSTLDEALVMAREAIECHLEGMLMTDNEHPSHSAVHIINSNDIHFRLLHHYN